VQWLHLYRSPAAQLIEVGAGVGYWVYALQQVHPDIPCIALDKVSSALVSVQLDATAAYLDAYLLVMHHCGDRKL
jgi:tRNA G46 methylase TrmB